MGHGDSGSQELDQPDADHKPGEAYHGRPGSQAPMGLCKCLPLGPRSSVGSALPMPQVPTPCPPFCQWRLKPNPKGDPVWGTLEQSPEFVWHERRNAGELVDLHPFLAHWLLLGYNLVPLNSSV